jgi:tRNA pseudouridine65 synthase
MAELVVYEDDVCFVVNKPNNVVVHHSKYAGQLDELSLVELLRLEGYETPVPIHRLDRKTSGLILFVKDASNARQFQQLFDEQLIHKEYRALLRGHLPAAGIIDTPVKNERGNHKEALTEYRCIEHFIRDYSIPPYEQQRYSLVEFIPKTGRMHQLRIHANKIAHPIINDPKYGNRHHNHYFQEELGIHFLFLHAQKLAFKHPFTGEFLAVEAPLPDFWQEFLNK